MKRKKLRSLWLALTFLMAFLLWTLLLCVVDVRPIGPQGSTVGLATLNECASSAIGVHMHLYVLTDWLGLVPLGVMFGFAMLGVVQWICRKRISSVDWSLWVLGGFYVTVLLVYLLFEALAINYRPVLIDGVKEASYPSSTTLLVLCIMPTAILQWRDRIKNNILRRFVILSSVLFTVFTVLGRVLSGVHWLTDIIGGLLLSASLVTFYFFFSTHALGAAGTIRAMKRADTFGDLDM